MSSLANPAAFCANLDKGLGEPEKSASFASASKILKKVLPNGTTEIRFASRAAGKGSLGRQRFVAIGNLTGGEIVREVKALATSAWVFAHPDVKASGIHYEEIVNSAVRCVDPFVKVINGWITR